MKSNIDEETELNFLRDLFQRLASSHPEACFICGSSQEKSSDGLPAKVLICPAEGVDLVGIYERVPKGEL